MNTKQSLSQFHIGEWISDFNQTEQLAYDICLPWGCACKKGSLAKLTVNSPPPP